MHPVILVLALGLASAAEARQSAPRALNPDSQVSARLALDGERLPDGSLFDCYAIETSPGQQVNLSIETQAFAGRIWVARGGQCASARLQHDSGASGPPQLDFTAAGGRYLVLVRPRSAEGSGLYKLKIQGGLPQQMAAAETRPGEAERLALMNRQVQQREARLAAEAARQAAEAEQRRLDELQRRQWEAEAEAERQANAGAIFNAFIGGFSSEMNNIQNQQANQQAFLNDLARQNQQIARQREQVERAQQRAREMEQEQQNAQRQQNARGLASQLAEANAYREREMAQTTDPAERQRLAAQSADALATARQLGVEGEVRSQTQAILAGSQSSAIMDHADARQQSRNQMEAERRATEQRQIQQAEQRRLAKQRQQEEQRTILQAEQRRLENQRQASNARAVENTRQADANIPTIYSPAPPVGRLGQDWSPWFPYATHNGAVISWRARINDRESLRVQWQCDNRSDERRYCSISDKAYTCFAGNSPAGQGGGIGEASDVAPGRQYAFGSEIGCRGDGLTFLLPQARVSAMPAS